MTSNAPLSTLEKALQVNLDSSRYGTFAEIGAGQEVVRWFFQAGAAAGTIAKSISAYDMQVSDAIYGECPRYVCRERLEAMLQYEQALTRERLTPARGDTTRFFTFADTVSARNFQGTNECHAWMGIRYQSEPHQDDNVVVVHVRMLDSDNRSQQEALGIVGVNLIHAAYAENKNADAFVAALADNLSSQRIEIDMVDFSGPSFSHVDNRVMSLKLVEQGLTGAAMFAADGTVLQPSEALRKKTLLVERGRFRPVTHVNIDMLNAAMRASPEKDAASVLPIMEISMHSLTEDGDICLADFVSRAEVLSVTGYTVMISDYPEYHRLARYLKRYTDREIGMVLGIKALENLFAERYYEDLDGGMLESLGRLFSNQVRMYVYPQKHSANGALETLQTLQLDQNRQQLLNYLCGSDKVVALDDICHDYLDIYSPDVLRMIGSGEPAWREMVPRPVADAIVARKLFGYCG